jgi:hypothetical protein
MNGIFERLVVRASMRIHNEMKQFAIVAVLVLSPLNGLWVLCAPAGASARAGQPAPARCQTICPAHQGDSACLASLENLAVAPIIGLALGPVCVPVVAGSPLMFGEPIAELSVPLRDRSLSPQSPPPKA